MKTKFATDEQVEQEIKRLLASEDVKLAKREETIKNRCRQYMYSLRSYENRGKLLNRLGYTLENIDEKLTSDDEEME